MTKDLGARVSVPLWLITKQDSTVRGQPLKISYRRHKTDYETSKSSLRQYLGSVENARAP